MAHKKLLIFFSIVAIIGLTGSWLTRDQSDAQVKAESDVRDEFIEKLVNETDQPYPLVATGRQYLQQGEPEKARRLFKKATELDRNYRDAFYHLGITERSLGNTDKALFALTRARAIDPLYQPTFEALIEVYQKRGDTTKVSELEVRSKGIE